MGQFKVNYKDIVKLLEEIDLKTQSFKILHNNLSELAEKLAKITGGIEKKFHLNGMIFSLVYRSSANRKWAVTVEEVIEL